MALKYIERSISSKRYNPYSYLTQRNLCPERTLTTRFQRQRVAFAEDLYKTELKAHFGCVNAIEFSHNGGCFIASGGDDRRVLVWNTEKALSKVGGPQHMKGEHNSNIFSLAFDCSNKKVFSGGNDEQVLMHDVETGSLLDVFLHEDAVYGLSCDPNNEHVFASACDDGRILIYDIREPPSSDPFCLSNYVSSMHAVMYNPFDPRLVASANVKEGVGLWDVRHPRTCLIRYGGSLTQQSCMSVRINALGDKIIALRRRLPPVLYNIHDAKPICEFDHQGYYNSCTMKSCCFAGDYDQYILSGSDDFNLYMWKIPDNLSERSFVNCAHLVLKGHRSIVNQVRYNAANDLILSSGVEKVIKAWSPYPVPDSLGGITKDRPNSGVRPIYTHEEYINLVLNSGHVMSHDYSHQSTDEDPRMMAFFDSLVQRELEGWSSEEPSSDDEFFERVYMLSRSEMSETESQSAPEEARPSRASPVTDVDEGSFSPFTVAFASVMAAQAAEDGTSRLFSIDSNDSQSAGNRLQDPEQKTDETISAEQLNTSTHIMEGQTPMPNRRTINDLILQNKKEFQKSLIEQRRKRRAELKKRKRKRVIASSDSSDDALDKQKSGAGEFSSDSDGDVTSPSNSKTHVNPKVKSQLKRLKNLRAAVLNSDSEMSDGGRKMNSQEGMSLVISEEKLLDNVHDLVKNKNENSGTSYKIDAPELGPFLHRKDGPTGPSQSNSNNYDKNGNISTSTTIDVTAQVMHKSQSCDPSTLTDVELNNSETKELCCDVDSCDNDREVSLPDSNMNVPSTSTENLADRLNNNNDQPVWTEFKRFKHKMEKARRYYRKRSSENQSDDD